MVSLLKQLFYGVVIVAYSTMGLTFHQASAQTYLTHELRFIAAFPPGSGSDTLVRYIAEKMRPLVPQPIVVENKPGAAGVLAAEYVVRSKPDGHTVLVHAANTMVAVKHLLKNPPFDPAQSIQIAATINKLAFVLAVDAKSPWTNLTRLTADMKEKGEKATYGSSANVGAIMGALYRERAGLKAINVQYRSGPDMLNDLGSGTLDFILIDPVLARSQEQAGRIRILAQASKGRLASAPNIPTMSEQGVSMELLSWFAAMVPSATPRSAIEQINELFNKVTAMEQTKQFLLDFGGEPWITSPDKGQAQLLKDLKDWQEYIRLAKLPLQG